MAPPVAKVVISGVDSPALVGSPRTLRATAVGTNGKPIPGAAVTWGVVDTTTRYASVSADSTTGDATLTPRAAGTVTITATSRGVTGRATLTVRASEPGIAISVSPTSVAPEQGGTDSVTVTLVRSGGFAGAVTVAVAGLSIGVTASALTFGVGVTSATLTLTAASDARIGNATLMLTASATGVTSATATLALSVTAATGAGGDVVLDPDATHGTPVDAPLHALRVTPANTEPWRLSASTASTLYGIRTMVGTARECHVFRRPSGVYNGPIDYDTAVTLVAADPGVTVSITALDDDGRQSATARVLVSGVVVGVSLVTLACGSETVTVRVLVGPAGDLAADGVTLVNVPNVLADTEYVPPATDAAWHTATSAQDVMDRAPLLKLGDVLAVPDDVAWSFNNYITITKAPAGSERGRRYIVWATANANAALGDGSAFQTRVGSTKPAHMPDFSCVAPYAFPLFNIGKEANHLDIRGIALGTTPGAYLNQAVMFVGRYLVDDPAQQDPATQGVTDLASEQAHHVRSLQCFHRGGTASGRMPEALYEATVSGAAVSDNGTTVVVPVTSVPAGAVVGMLARIRRVGVGSKVGRASYPTQFPAYLEDAFDHADANASSGRLLWRVSAIAGTNVSLVAYTDSTTGIQFSSRRPYAAGVVTGQTLEFLPDPSSGTVYPRVTRNMVLNGRHLVVDGCFLGGVRHPNDSDSQHIAIYQGTGPISLGNNDYEGGASEPITAGGVGYAPGLAPTDIHVFRSTFLTTAAPYVGGGYGQVKNLFELKVGTRVLVEQCRYQGCTEGDGQQHGVAWAIKTSYYNYRGESTPHADSDTKDVILRDNHIDQVLALANIQGNESALNGSPLAAGPTARVALYNNVVTRVGKGGSYLGSGVTGTRAARFLGFGGISDATTTATQVVHAHHNTAVWNPTATNGQLEVAVALNSTATANPTFRPRFSAIRKNVFTMGGANLGGSVAPMLAISVDRYNQADDDTNAAYLDADGTSTYGLRDNVGLAWTTLAVTGQAVTLTRNLRVIAAPAIYASGSDGEHGQFVGNPYTTSTPSDLALHASVTGVLGTDRGIDAALLATLLAGVPLGRT